VLNSVLTEQDTVLESVMVCALDALTPEQKIKTCVLLDELQEKRLEIKEFPDGYAFRYKLTGETFSNVAEFVGYERLCCPLFDFKVTVERDGGSFWLLLCGREGVKEFIAAEHALDNNSLAAPE
jgi:hypothetical protein